MSTHLTTLNERASVSGSAANCGKSKGISQGRSSSIFKALAVVVPKEADIRILANAFFSTHMQTIEKSPHLDENEILRKLVAYCVMIFHKNEEHLTKMKEDTDAVMAIPGQPQRR